ncbi:MAG: HyaD/HybD family hydrogenase maturation endopeptidase [Gemmatimonadales bacterium]
MSGTVVIGLGNPLMGDDGAGLVALEVLRDEWLLDGVELVDGGTWGMSLLPDIEDADRVIFIDAIVAGGAPGDVVILERERLPIYFTRALSPHQTDLRDVLAAAELRGTLPSESVAIGVEPQVVALGTELSAVVQGSIAALVAAIVVRLGRWGHGCERRAADAACTK